jgi:vancomycin aglycone glucosyltransferase
MPMKIAIVINGTRGDVQPMLALATGLMKNGHAVIFCAPPEHQELVEKYGCPFIPFGPNYKKIFQDKPDMKGGATKSPPPKEMKRQTAEQIDRLPGLIRGSDLVLGVGFVLGVHTVANLLNVPYRFVMFYPVLLGPSKTDPLIHRMLFAFGRSLTNMVMKGLINRKRAALNLPPVKDVWGHWMGDHVIVACDRALNEAREGLYFNFTQTGYMLLPSLSGMPEAVVDFLKTGPPPVYIGFGSNPFSNPGAFHQICQEVMKSTGQRLIVTKGWAVLPGEDSPEILYVDEVPFEHLLPRVAAVVHHGGTGTMAAAARAGVPQAAFPFMADQFENRKQIMKLGLGPTTCDFKKLSAEALATAITECLTNEKYKENAAAMAKKLQNPNGLEMTIGLIEHME